MRFLEKIHIVIGKEIQTINQSGKLLKNYSFLLLCYVQIHLKNYSLGIKIFCRQSCRQTLTRRFLGLFIIASDV